MMNKEAIMEKLGEVKDKAVEGFKEEATFTLKGAMIGITMAYALKAGKKSYEKIKEFAKESL